MYYYCLSFGRTTEIDENRYILEDCMEYFYGDSTSAPYFAVVAIEDNLYHGLLIYEFATEANSMFY